MDPVTDALLAKFVVNSHRKSHPSFDPAEEASLLPEAQPDDEVRRIRLISCLLSQVELRKHKPTRSSPELTLSAHTKLTRPTDTELPQSGSTST